MRIKQVTIIGVGLIGGSIAKALARLNEFRIVCVDADCSNLEGAKNDGFTIKSADDIQEGVENADLIFICTPVTTIPKMVKCISPYLKDGAIITDVGSTKKWAIKEIDANITKNNYYIGGHPMAGSEKSGYQNSIPDLFNNASYILIPDESTPGNVVNEMINIVRMMGAQPVIMDMDNHDASVAFISHLPYVASVCLSSAISKTGQDDEIIKISAGSLRDMTRVSDSSIPMWRDICATNTQKIKDALVKYREELDSFVKLLDDGDYEVIEEYLKSAKEFRQRLAKVKGY